MNAALHAGADGAHAHVRCDDDVTYTQLLAAVTLVRSWPGLSVTAPMDALVAAVVDDGAVVFLGECPCPGQL